MANSGMEKRRHERIEHHYVIRFRELKPESLQQEWEVSTVRNISKSGILFSSPHYYKPGSELEIRIKNPLLRKDSKCRSRVVRSIPSKKIKNTYEVAVNITEFENGTEEIFYKTIDFFCKKERKTSNL